MKPLGTKSWAARRFVHDVMHGVDIIMEALQPVFASGSDTDAAADAARNDALAAAAAAAESALADQQPSQPPLEVVVHVSQITVLLPTSSKYVSPSACWVPSYISRGLETWSLPPACLSHEACFLAQASRR